MSQPIHLSYLNGPDVDALAMTDDEILSAVEGALAAQGRGETVIEPRVHLVPDPEAGKLTERTLHAELAEILAGKKPGRERDDETILFWHRGLGTTDIALGHAMLEKAARLGVGQRLRFA